MATALSGDAAERSQAYAEIERAVRDAAAQAGSARADRLAFIVACVKPLVVEVLSAPASRIAQGEFMRAALLLYEMEMVDAIALNGEPFRKDDAGVMLATCVMAVPDSAFTAVLAKDQSQWTRDDMLLVAASSAWWPLLWAAGGTACFEAAGGIADMEPVTWFLTAYPYYHAEPADRFAPAALLCLDLIRLSEPDSQPEGVLAGAWMFMTSQTQQPVATVLWDAGFVAVFHATMQRFSPMERVSRKARRAGASCAEELCHKLQSAFSLLFTQSSLRHRHRAIDPPLAPVSQAHGYRQLSLAASLVARR